MIETYCCSMRRHFILGIVGVRSGENIPVDVVDFLKSFEGPPIIEIKYCPFCGQRIDGNQTKRTVVIS